MKAATPKPIAWIVIPCYNEQEVLPITAPLFLGKIRELADTGKIGENSKVLFVNDGSTDGTWETICSFASTDCHALGLCLSRNRGHQNALLAGLMEAREKCDFTISIDCDGQDDINAMNEMVDAYLGGCDVVYGVGRIGLRIPALSAVQRSSIIGFCGGWAVKSFTITPTTVS